MVAGSTVDYTAAPDWSSVDHTEASDWSVVSAANTIADSGRAYIKC